MKIVTLGNPGRTKAEAAAKQFGCTVVYPVFPEGFRLPPNKKGITRRPTDWNDLHVHFGISKVREQLATYEQPKPHLITFTDSALLKEIPPRKFVLKP